MAATDTALQSEYVEKVDADLKHNLSEQERLRSEAEALELQLEGLRKDHDLLVSVKAALEQRAISGSAQKARGKQRETGAANSQDVAVKRRKYTRSAVPLRELVVAVLAERNEPCSAAEVTKVLASNQTDRALTVQLVRNALESSVAKNQSERIKQQNSVYYMARNQAPAAEPSNAPEEMA
ncbi:hypothetical protein [Streptomyces sp. NPDC013457]|uniref:hypothetical protein n=1 Tax=Streptomyces sp. NPDC013457 TaxID=3364866 RepID=UPI0036F822BB